jgi:hypothetical protein
LCLSSLLDHRIHLVEALLLSKEVFPVELDGDFHCVLVQGSATFADTCYQLDRLACLGVSPEVVSSLLCSLDPAGLVDKPVSPKPVSIWKSHLLLDRPERDTLPWHLRPEGLLLLGSVAGDWCHISRFGW